LVGERRVYYCDIGTPASVLKPRWPSVDFAPLTAEKWWLPFDETHEALMDRVRAFKQRWAARTERILVASHWYFIHGMTGVAAENAQIIERKL